MTKALYDMLNKFAKTVPNVFMALIIFIIGYLVSKVLAKIVKKLLVKLGIDKIGEKLNDVEIIRKSSIEIKISELTAKLLYYFSMLFFIVASTSVLGIPEISQLVSDIFQFIPNLVVALIVLILGTLLADILRKGILTALKSLGIPSAAIIASIFFYFLFVNVFISALSQAEIDTTFLSQNISIILGGIVAAFAIGYGLASKDLMSNLVAAFYTKKQFNVGDKVTIEGETGVITSTENSKIEIKTESGKVVIPFSKTLKEKVVYHD